MISEHIMDKPNEEDPFINIQLIALSFMMILLSIKSDRYFPFPSMPDFSFQVLLIPYTLLFLLTAFFLLFPEQTPLFIKSFANKLSTLHLAIVIAILFETMTFVLLFVQNVRYKEFGYKLDMLLTGILILIIFFGLFGIFFWQKSRSIYLFILASISYTSIYILSIFSFPLHPYRSDMLPLIVAGCKNFLMGSNPYTFYHIPHSLTMTYLPGLWLSFLPSAIFGFDPRIINLFCIILSITIIFLFGHNQEKAAIFLSIFLLNPYFQYRHEIYLGVVFLGLSLAYVLLINNKPILSSVFFGYAMTTYQFVWVIFPFYAAYIYNKYGKKTAFIVIGIVTTIFVVMIGSFFVWSPSDFILGVFQHWANTGDVPTVNLAYFVTYIIPWDYLLYLQGFMMIIFFLVAFKKLIFLRETIRWMTIGLLVFIILNRIIEVYFFLLVFLLMTMYILTYNIIAPQDHIHTDVRIE